MSFGRIHCFLVATKGGDVIYERFYERLSELDKAEIRKAFQLATSGARLANETTETIGVFRSTRFVLLPAADCVYYLMGSGEYDELACCEILHIIIGLIRDILGNGRSSPPASALLDKYTKLAIIVDEVINEGILETTDREAVRKALKNKAAWE